MTDLVERYRTAMALPADTPLTDDDVHRHWELERRLTAELLASSPEERWEVFERCYGELYGGALPWLNTAHPAEEMVDRRAEFDDWAALVGAPPKRVYEIGSGSGSLARSLAARGHTVRATEITRHRGERTEADPRLTWASSDGVHLTRFEAPSSYDVVASSQVVEHLHPEDLVMHFAQARQLLAEGGRYLFTTPHRFDGPSDVSDVFGHEVSAGMHLKEYTYRELREALTAAGYARVASVFRPPQRARRGPLQAPTASAGYLAYLERLEAGLERLPHARRRVAARYARAVGFRTIFLVAWR